MHFNQNSFTIHFLLLLFLPSTYPQNPGDSKGKKISFPKTPRNKKSILHVPHSPRNETWQGIANPNSGQTKLRR